MTDTTEAASPNDSYLKHREALTAFEFATGKEVDKWILSIAGGALAFSMTFVKDFLGTPQKAAGPWWLCAAWTTLAIAVGLLLLNLHLSYCAAVAYRQIADEEMRKYLAQSSKYQGNLWENMRSRQEGVWSSWAIGKINWISILAFMAGMASLGRFLYLNII